MTFQLGWREGNGLTGSLTALELGRPQLQPYLTPSNVPLWHNEANNERRTRDMAAGFDSARLDLACQRVFNNWIFNSCKKCNTPVPPFPLSHCGYCTLRTNLSTNIDCFWEAFPAWFLLNFICFSNRAVSLWNMQIISMWNNFCEYEKWGRLNKVE